MNNNTNHEFAKAVGDLPPAYLDAYDMPKEIPIQYTGEDATHHIPLEHHPMMESQNIPDMATPLYGSTDGYVVTQTAAQTPYTTVSLVSTPQPDAESRFPDSHALYSAMSAQFGPHNIVPPPDFLQTDAARLEWLKRDQNALLYFIHNKKAHLENMQKMLDVPLCCALCTYVPTYPTDEYSPCYICCVETCSCCCCAWPSLGFLYKMYLPSRANIPAPSSFPSCNGGVKFRQVVLKRWRKSGLKIKENSCWSCCMLCWCQPCLAIQTANVSWYYYQARYGQLRVNTLDDETQYLNTIDPSGNYQKYYTDIARAASHPYSKCQTGLASRGRSAGALKSSPFITTAERNIQHTVSQVDMFYEMYKPNDAIIEHNKFWSGIHAVQMQ